MKHVPLLLFLSASSIASALGGRSASAAEPAGVSSVLPSGTAGGAGAAPAPAPQGVAVVALPGATDAAWPLAWALYDNRSLRPAGLDDATARLLCGERPSQGSPPLVRDLADMVSALHGDDAPTRALLSAIAGRLSVRALLVVSAGAGGVSARPFLPETGIFDAARYAPDDQTTPVRWAEASRSLARAFGVVASEGGPSATALATPAKPELPQRRAFYESGWFWGALGAAVLGGGAVFLATRDSGTSTIHLQVQVPH